jgi:sugar phosphate isomerase/epimerase
MTRTAARPAPFELAYSTACFPAATREEAILDGTTGVGWCEVALGIDDLATAVHWREVLDRGDVECWSVHAPFGQAVDLSAPAVADRGAALAANLRAAAIASELGARLLVVHAGAEPIAEPERPGHLAAARDGLRRLERACADSGLIMALEFLPRTCPGNRVEELEYLLAGLPEDAVGVCLDVNHANLGQDLGENVRRLGRRIATLHISDNDGVDEQHWLPGQGRLDWAAIVASLRSTGYRGPFTYESSRDRAGGVITPLAIRENYERLIRPLLAKE